MKKYLQLLLISTSVLAAAEALFDYLDVNGDIARLGVTQTAKNICDNAIVAGGAHGERASAHTSFGVRKLYQIAFLFDEGGALHGELGQFKEALTTLINKRLEYCGKLSIDNIEDLITMGLVIKYRTGQVLGYDETTILEKQNQISPGFWR